MIMGTGFPPFRGGLLKYADKEGLAQILSELDVFAAKYGKRFQPSEALASLVKSGSQFHTRPAGSSASSEPAPLQDLRS